MVSYSLGVTNTTASEHTVAPVALSLATNYSKVSDEPGELILSNNTADLSQGEIIKLTCKKVKQVKTAMPAVYPTKVKDGVVYTIEVNNLLRKTDDSDPSLTEDHPGFCKISIGHDISAPWTSFTELLNSHALDELRRALGVALSNEGAERLDALAKGALTPTAD